MPALIAIATFITVLLTVYAVILYLSASRRAFAARLANYIELPAAPVPAAAARPAGGSLTGWRAWVRRLSRHFDSPQWARHSEKKLIQAGVPLRGSEFLVICAALAGLGALAMLALSGGQAAAAPVGGLLGFFAPVLVINVKAARRIKKFNDQLGDALVLVANSLRTGYSFLQAIEMVSREMPDPVAGEFGRTMKEMSLGVTTEQAMNNLARRVDSDDLDLVITAVLIQRQVGGNLAEVLDNIAGTIRARVKLKGEIRTLTAQGRISGIILALLPLCVGIAVFLLNPGYISLLFTHPVGKALVAASIGSQLVGAVIIRKIVNIRL